MVARLRPTGVVLTLLVLVILQAGCGDGGNVADDKVEIRRTLGQAMVAFQRGDHASICSLVASDVRKDWAQFARRHPGQFSTEGCVAFVEDFYSRRSSDDSALKRQLRAIRAARVTVVGETAIVRPPIGKPSFLELENGGWRLTTEDVYVDTSDAGEVAERWADQQLGNSEEAVFEPCSARGKKPLFTEFRCPVALQPGTRWQERRWFTLQLRAVNDHRDLRIVRAERDRHRRML